MMMRDYPDTMILEFARRLKELSADDREKLGGSFEQVMGLVPLRYKPWILVNAAIYRASAWAMKRQLVREANTAEARAFYSALLKDLQRAGWSTLSLIQAESGLLALRRRDVDRASALRMYRRCDDVIPRQQIGWL